MRISILGKSIYVLIAKSRRVHILALYKRWVKDIMKICVKTTISRLTVLIKLNLLHTEIKWIRFLILRSISRTQMQTQILLIFPHLWVQLLLHRKKQRFSNSAVRVVAVGVIAEFNSPLRRSLKLKSRRHSIKGFLRKMRIQQWN